MEPAEQKLVAEVIGAHRGSGFLVAPGRILTALHVVLGDDPPDLVPPGVTAEVRLFGETVDAIPAADRGWDSAANRARLAAMKLPWHPATLVWPRAGARARSADLALLELPAPAAIHRAAPTGLRLAGTRRRETGCLAGGFPAFRAEGLPDDAIWEMYPLEGKFSSALRRTDGARFIDVTSNALPGKVDGWRGLSGAAVWVDSGEGCTEIAGVMHALVSELESNNVLLYWPLDLVPADDPDFWRLTGLAPPAATSAPARAPAPAVTPKPLIARLSDNFFRFDRIHLSDSFREWLSGDGLDEFAEPPRFGRAGLPRRPAVVVLRGHRVDEPTLCARRFADILAAEAWPGSGALYATPVQIDCGPVTLPAPSRRRTLLRQWAQDYSDQRLPLDANVHEIIRAGLTDGGRARCILIEHSTAEFGEGCREVLAAAVAPLRTWQPDPRNAGVTPPVVLLSILTGSDGEPPDAEFRPTRFGGKAASVEAALAALAAATPELEWYTDIPDLGAELARPQHVAEWLDEIVRVEQAAPFPAQIGAEIELRLRPHTHFPITFARVAVDSVIIAQGSRAQ